MKIRKLLLALSAILIILTIGARFYQLDLASYWLDEAISVEMANTGFKQAWILRTGDYNPPGHDLLLVPIIEAFGVSEATTRSLSALAGSLSILALLLLFARSHLVAEGIFAALITGLSFAHFHFSREVRPYIFLFLFVSVLLTVIHKKLKHEESWRQKDFLLVSLSLFLLNYFHYAGVVFSLAFFIGLLFFRKFLYLQWIHVFSLGAIQVLLYAPWLHVLLKHSKAPPAHIGTTSEPILQTLANLSYFYIGNQWVGLTLLLLMIGILMWAFKTCHKERWALAFFHFTWIAPIAIKLFIVNIITPAKLFEKYTFDAYAGFLISLALSWSLIFKKLPKTAIVAAAFFLAFEVHALFRRPLLETLVPFDERGVTQFIVEQNRPCRTVVTTFWAWPQVHYFRRMGIKQRIFEARFTKAEELAAESCPYLYFLDTDEKIPDNETLQFIRENFETKSTHQFSLINLTVMERKAK